MKNNNYPNWLVSLEIAQQLKEIGFHELVQNSYYSNKGTERILSSTLRLEKKSLADANILNFLVSLPTWEQVFEWFREKGMFHSICIVDDLLNDVKFFEAEIRDKNADIICVLSRVTYEEAREYLVKALIRTYKNEKL